MATAPPSTKGTSPGSNNAGPALLPGPAGQAPGNTSPHVRRRQPPVIAWAIVGAILAGIYGRLALAMHFGPPLVMVALGGLTLVLGAAALWRVVDPLTRTEIPAVLETRAPHRIRELEREKQTVLKAIKEIELDYQMRKISEADYRDMVERYRARALRIMSDLAAGDDYRALIERELKDRLAARAAVDALETRGIVARGSDANMEPPGADARTSTQGTQGTQGKNARAEPRAPDAGKGPISPATSLGAQGLSTGAVCAACATANDDDARFCKKCGQKMNSSVAPG